MQNSEFEQPQLTPQRAATPQAEPAETPGDGSSISAPEAKAGTPVALATPAQITGHADRTVAGGMDRVIRASTAVAVLALACLAAYISYWHAYAVVRAYGESGITARLEPATIDGLVYASSMIVLYAARHRIPVPPLARWLLGLGITATLATNMAQGWSHGPIGMAVAAWPAVSLVGSYELLVWLIRTAGTPEKALAAEAGGGSGRCALFPRLCVAPAGSAQRSQNACEEPYQPQRPVRLPDGRAVTKPREHDDQAMAGSEAVNSQAVAAYRLSVQAGNPLSERKLAQMFGRTSRRWARARITEARGIPRPEADRETPHVSPSGIPAAALPLSMPSRRHSCAREGSRSTSSCRRQKQGTARRRIRCSSRSGATRRTPSSMLAATVVPPPCGWVATPRFSQRSGLPLRYRAAG